MPNICPPERFKPTALSLNSNEEINARDLIVFASEKWKSSFYCEY